jgi:tetratricopeptide (TPR) repeat protein
VAIDRDGTLRKAEKFLRQGRLDQAIAEYHRIIEDQPEDWSTINAVGDLLVRAGQTESGIEHFTRIADHFFDEGFHPKAAAVYKKILKLTPDSDHAALRTAEIAERQGLFADAKAALSHVAARRIKRGDRTGAAEVHLRLGALDPGDLPTAVTAARAAAELGNLRGAVDRLLQIAGEYARLERADDAIRVLSEANGLEPGNPDVRVVLSRRLVESGALERAIEFATSAPEFKAIAAAYYARGRGDEALQVLQWALDQDPSDIETRRQLVRSHLGRTELERARALLDGVAENSGLLIELAEINLRTGRRQEGRDAAARLLAAEPDRRDEVMQLGLRLSETDGDAGFECVDVATDAAVAEHEISAAAQALNDLLALVPHHVPALMKLVEVCVDGGLGAAMYAAQAQLADAYLERGQALEARVISEDLFAREPWEPVNSERFRKALTMLGEPDPDAVIADRLSGDSPFTSTDLMLEFSFNELATPSGDAVAEQAPVAAAAPDADDAVAIEPPPEPPAAEKNDTPAEPIAPTGRRGTTTVERPLAAAAGSHTDDDAIEIDLGETFGGWGDRTLGSEASVEEAPAGLAGLERVFEGFRDEAVRHGAQDAAAQLQQALALEEAGKTDRAIRLFERAARSPRHRLRAASELARIQRRLGHTRESIEWLERAAESSLAGTEESHELLYDLGLLLAEAGETERALAVLLELQADVPDYRDVARQVARLSQKS